MGGATFCWCGCLLGAQDWERHWGCASFIKKSPASLCLRISRRQVKEGMIHFVLTSFWFSWAQQVCSVEAGLSGTSHPFHWPAARLWPGRWCQADVGGWVPSVSLNCPRWTSSTGLFSLQVCFISPVAGACMKITAKKAEILLSRFFRIPFVFKTKTKKVETETHDAWG